MARPNKHDSKKLTDVFPPVRCKKSEKNLIRKKADQAGLSMSEYIRRMACEGQVIVKETVSQIDPSLVFQVQAIGRNLNQLVKISNTIGEPVPGLETALEKVIAISDQIINCIEPPEY